MAISVPIISSFKDDGIKKATSSLEGFAKKAGSLAKTAAIGIAGIGAGVATGAWKAIDAASSIGEAISKTNVIFGEGAKGIEEFAETAAMKFGLSKKAVYDAAGVFGTFGKAAGLTGEDLATFSTDFTGLASDLASFNDTTPEEAIDAIGAALRGESEPLRRYGVLLDDARLRARALELGIYDGTGALTAEQKILAAQAEIWAQTGDAQGDFARTSDTLANRQRQLRATFSNVVIAIGQKLLPIALRLAEFFSNRVVPVVERLVNAFSKDGLGGVVNVLVEEMRKALPKVGAFLWELVRTIGSWIVNVGWPYLKEKLPIWAEEFVGWIKPKIPVIKERLWEFLRAVGDWVVDTAWPWLVEKVGIWGDALVDWVKDSIDPALEELNLWIEAIGNWITDEAAPKIAEKLPDLTQKFTEWAGELIPVVIPKLNKFVYDLGVWLVTKAAPKMRELGFILAEELARGLVQGLKDAGALKYFGIGGLILDRFVDETPPTPPSPIGNGNVSTGGIQTMSLVPAPYRGGGDTYITIEGALDSVSVARQVKQLLTDDARRSGTSRVIMPVMP